MRDAHPVYPGGPVCQPNCPGPWSQYHDGYADGYENALAARSEPHGVDHHTDGTHGCYPGAWMECRRCNPLAARSEPDYPVQAESCVTEGCYVLRAALAETEPEPDWEGHHPHCPCRKPLMFAETEPKP